MQRPARSRARQQVTEVEPAVEREDFAAWFSPKQARPRALFYLMWVEKTYANHADCWTGLGGPMTKSAHAHPYGDIYEPLLTPVGLPWTETSYKAHLAGHCHGPADREKDIEVSYYRAGRHPRLLVGDTQQSFLWSAPQIRLNPNADAEWRTAHHRFYPQLSNLLVQFI